MYGDKGEVPEEEYLLPIGVADIKRPGSDVTIVSFGKILKVALNAAAELEKDLEGAEIEWVGEGIKITFREGIQFALNSAELSETSKTNLTELAETLKKYDDTNILIEGHTDITGTREYNMVLSDKRAQSVADYLKEIGVPGKRVTTEGYGPDQPVADNDSDYGRQQNRRVEVAIFANEKLKKKAEKGELGEVTAEEEKN